MAANDLNAARLRELLHYDPETGIFTNRIKRSRKIVAGQAAGSINKILRYVVIGIDGDTWLAHRLAFLWITGEWPKGKADHRAGDRANNRWANLRDLTHAANIQNVTTARRNNTSGMLGASRDKRGGKWRAAIVVNYKQVHIGTYSTAELAHAAYVEAKRRLHPGNTM